MEERLGWDPFRDLRFGRWCNIEATSDSAFCFRGMTRDVSDLSDDSCLLDSTGLEIGFPDMSSFESFAMEEMEGGRTVMLLFLSESEVRFLFNNRYGTSSSSAAVVKPQLWS